MTITLGELAAAIDAVLDGDPHVRVRRVATLDQAGAGDVSFLYDRRYRRFLGITGASAVILAPGDAAQCVAAKLIVDDPYLGFARAATVLHPPAPVVPGVHPSAWVSPQAQVSAGARVGAQAVIERGARIGDGADVGAGCLVGEDAVIGEFTRLHAGVTVCHGVRIGRRCIVFEGAVIGADGFGLARDGERWMRIPQIGSVQIGDDVEIGANTTVDRGTLRDTVIEHGVKIDNLVQIGHNCRIGAHTAIAGCAGISGSVTVGRRCLIGGGVGLAGHLEVADDVVLTGFTMVTKSIRRPGTYSSGWPSRDARQWRREVAALRRLGARGGGTEQE